VTGDGPCDNSDWSCRSWREPVPVDVSESDFLPVPLSELRSVRAISSIFVIFEGDVYLGRTMMVDGVQKLSDDKKMQKFEGIDGDSFRSLGNEFFADQNHVYHYKGENEFVILDAVQNPDEFDAIGNDYVVDRNEGGFVYDILGKPVPFSDGPSFEVLEDDFYRDKKQVYYRGDVLQFSDPATFRKAGINYAGYYRDKFQGYYFGEIMSLAEYEERILNLDLDPVRWVKKIKRLVGKIL